MVSPVGVNRVNLNRADYAIDERIVILFPACKVLSKEPRSRLKDWLLYSEYGACSLM
jgi:hypothetical protein